MALNLEGKKYVRILFACIFCAALLRFTALGGKSLWFDEAYSVDRAQLTQEHIWSGKYEPVHPPLYYSILHAWIGLFGSSETAVRALSALASTFSLLAFYFLGRQLVGRDVALVAVSLLAFSPLDIWYAQEARMPVFVNLAALLTAVGLVWDHWSGVLLAAIALTLGLYFDYTMVPLWIGMTGLWFVLLLQRSHKTRRVLVWLVAAAVAWGLYQFWLPQLLNMLERLNNVFIFNRMLSLTGLPAVAAHHYLIGMLVVGLAISGCTYVFSRWLQNPKFQKTVFPIFLLGYCVAVVLFTVPRFYTIKRILITGWVFIILFIGWIIVNSGHRKHWIWRGLLVLSLLSSVITLLTPKDDWRSVASFFNHRSAPEMVIWVDPAWDRMAYEYYAPRYEARHGSVQDLAQLAKERDIWLIAERYFGQSVPSSESEVWLDANMVLVETISFYRLEVRHYSPE